MKMSTDEIKKAIREIDKNDPSGIYEIEGQDWQIVDGELKEA